MKFRNKLIFFVKKKKKKKEKKKDKFGHFHLTKV